MMMYHSKKESQEQVSAERTKRSIGRDKSGEAAFNWKSLSLNFRLRLLFLQLLLSEHFVSDLLDNARSR
jgi:hypothetical protein